MRKGGGGLVDANACFANVIADQFAASAFYDLVPDGIDGDHEGENI